MGMNAHFAGKSLVRVAVEARVARPSHTPLDGTFLAWANPSGGAASVGDYPFVFDCPDAATHLELPLPATVTAQIAAFAQQVSLYESPAAYVSSQAAEGMSSPSRSFIPSGLMSPDGTPRDPPEPHALIAGHVLEAATRVNAISGQPYWWALVETVGGTFDAVIDPQLLADAPRAGNVLAGWFWLSGRLMTGAPRRHGCVRLAAAFRALGRSTAASGSHFRPSTLRAAQPSDPPAASFQRVVRIRGRRCCRCAAPPMRRRA